MIKIIDISIIHYLNGLFLLTESVLNVYSIIYLNADPNDRAVYGVGLRPFVCWDCGFESRRGHECLSLVIVVCCQVEVSASA
jgi:hypothetical protein